MKTFKINDNTSLKLVLGGFYNAYLIQCNSINILIDTGRKSKREILQKNLKKVLSPDQNLDYLILTHTHYDHCDNAAFIKEKWHCKIIVNELEKVFLEEGSTPLPRGTNLFTYLLTKMGNRFATGWYIYDKTTADIVFDEEYTLPNTNNSIKIIKTSGHSIGSSSIIIDNKVAIVGDTMFGASKTVFPHFADDRKALLQTWQHLIDKTNCEWFYPGHGKVISRERLQNDLARRKPDTQ